MIQMSMVLLVFALFIVLKVTVVRLLNNWMTIMVK